MTPSFILFLASHKFDLLLQIGIVICKLFNVLLQEVHLIFHCCNLLFVLLLDGLVVFQTR